MIRKTARFSRPAAVGALVASLTAAAAVAGTIHTFAVTQTIGSEGAYDFLQTTVPGGALQGETGPAASTGLGTPFGVFGKYGPPSGTSTLGLGVVGISTTGWGVVGESLNGYPALYAFPNGKDGVGLDAESDTSSAIYGETHSTTAAVDGADLFAEGPGDGLYAFSAKGDGIYAEGYGGNGIEAYSFDNMSGVYGESGGGDGVVGTSDSGFGLAGSNDGSPSSVPTGYPYLYAGTYSTSKAGPGVYGANSHDTGSVSGSSYSRYTGVSGYGMDGVGVYGYSKNNFGMIAESGGTQTALVVENDTTALGDEIVAGSGSGLANSTGFNFAVETNGDEVVGGTVTSGSGSFAVTRNPHADTVTYGAESTEPMVEDVGSARLVNGAAAVAIAPDFRQTIQDPGHYMVFVTPKGDSKGLYVTQETPAGFVVRESQGGRSTMDFDYRIVAQRYGITTGRLPHLATISPRMAQFRFAALHPPANAAREPLRYSTLAPLPRPRPNHAAHRHKTAPPVPPPGFLAGINR